MALEMKVYREVRAIEAKVMWGFTWRQLLALFLILVFGGGLFALTTYALILHGEQLQQATSNAMWVIFPIAIPLGFWGWIRPKGLKPEQFIGYWFRHYLSRKVINYVDTYGSDPAEQRVEPVHAVGAVPPGSAGRAARRARAAERRARKFVPQEHS